MKKLVSLIVALMMVLSVSASAVTFTESGYPIADEIINLEVAGLQPSYPDHDWNDSEFVNQIEQRLGIHLHYTPYSKDQWSQQLTLYFAEDALPDIIANLQSAGNFSYGQMVKYGEEGFLLDFAEYLDKMPFLTEFFGNHPDYQKYVTIDGQYLYGFPIMNVQGINAQSNYPITFDMDALAAIGVTEFPTTRDELYDVLSKLKEAFPDNVVYSGSPNLTDFMAHMVKWGYNIICRETNGYDVCVGEDGKLYLAELTEDFKDFVVYMKSLVDLGIYDSDWSVKTNDQTKERTLDNVYLILSSAYSNDYEALQAERGTAVKNWLPMNHAFVGDASEGKFAVLKNPISPNPNFIASADTEYPEAVARFLDYFFDEFGEGGDAALNGWAGVSFTPMEVMGTGVTMFDVEEQRGELSSWEYRSSVACWYQAFAAMWCKVNSNWMVYDYIEDKDRLLDMYKYCSIGNSNNWRAYCNREDGLSWKDSLAPLPYTTEEATERATLVTDITSYVGNMYANFITGTNDIDAEWDSFVDTLKAMGAERVIEIEQAAYDRLNG